MSQPIRTARPDPPGAVSGARALALVLVGLCIGVLGTVVAMTAWAQRAAYGDGLMAVLQAELGQLRRQVRRAGGCDLSEIERARSRLQLLAGDIPRAFPTGGSAMREMSADLAEAVTQPVSSCSALPARFAQVDQSCKACHSQFR